MERWWMYIIDRDGRLYTGITTDLVNRMRQHGRSAPLYREGPMSRTNAVKREKELKGWSRKKKLELIAKASPEQHEGSPAPVFWLFYFYELPGIHTSERISRKILLRAY